MGGELNWNQDRSSWTQGFHLSLGRRRHGSHDKSIKRWTISIVVRKAGCQGHRHSETSRYRGATALATQELVRDASSQVHCSTPSLMLLYSAAR